MRAFLKTLIGDGPNVAAVACVIAIGVLPAIAGHPSWGAVLMPLAALAAVAWLARR